MSENRCASCGDVIPEGTQVCYTCLDSVLHPDKKKKPKAKKKLVAFLKHK
jgi:predicted nucleic acid-binding Zn ribbon protein